LESVAFPAYLIDAQGRIRAINAAAEDLFGDQRGRLASSVVAPQYLAEARRLIALKLLKRSATDRVGVLVAKDGTLVQADISSVSLVNGQGQVVGIFGLIRPLDAAPARADHPDYHLTSRQREILGKLVAGQSTDQIARSLGIAPHTVRNHIRRLLRALGVHSRLEAVALALREQLVSS
jgi:PAS domain S-box-containing protein